MRYIIGILVFVAMYVGALVWKNTKIEQAKNLHLPTIYEIQKEKGIPVVTDRVHKGNFQEYITISGKFHDNTLHSFVPPFIRNKIRYGEMALVEFGESTKKLTGRVVLVSGDSNYLTGLFEVHVKFNERIPKGLGDVTVEIPVKEFQNVLLVPRASVSIRTGVPIVYAIESNKLKKKSVEIAGSNAEVHWIKSGVTSGENLVVSDTRYFEGGELVNVVDQNEDKL